MKSISFILLFILAQASSAMDVAITVDDLPWNGDLPAGMTRMQVAEDMLQVFKKHHIERVYGMINGSKVSESKDGLLILKQWVASNQLLGNHTFNHLDLAKVDSTQYIEDIKNNNPPLKRLMGTDNFRYFRYPYLAEGNTQEKRDTVRRYLFQHHYEIAPVTTDFFEYEWNDPYVRCVAKHDYKAIEWLKRTYLEQAINALTISHELSSMLFHRDIKNILLIHINAFTADMLDALLTEYENLGVKFISLPDALKDPAYTINPNVIRDRSYTFLNQVRLSRGLKNPETVEKLYNSLPEDQLKKLCL